MSHGPSEIILKYLFGAQETLLLVLVLLFLLLLLLLS